MDGSRTVQAEAPAAVELGRFVAGLAYEDLPAEVVAQARRCLADAAGCLVAAHRTDAGAVIRAFIETSGEAGEVRIPGCELRTSAGLASFANAQLINALDFDDIYAKGHPGATVNAVAIALGQAVGCSNRDLVTAVVAGYEVSCRVAISLVQTAPRKTVHGHGTWQVFGAAAAAAKLLGLGAEQTAHALAIAAANAPLPSVMKTVYGARPSMAKNNFGTAAWVGGSAARLAAAGFDGPLDVFEGDTGFWRMFGADGFDSGALLGGLGQDFELLKVGFKAFSTCRIVQSSVEAAVGAARAAGLGADGEALAELRIHGPEILSRPPFSLSAPGDMWAAQFSVPYAVALALLGIPSGPAWFEAATLSDPKVRSLASKVTMIPHIEASPHGGFHAARAELKTATGETYAYSVDVARGEHVRALTDAEVADKARQLVADRDPTRVAAKLIELRVDRVIQAYLTTAD